MPDPEVKFAVLPHADGSASYKHLGHSILAAVNGPIEVQRRDELPEDAFVEVNVREASGVGGPRERVLESLVHQAIRPLLLTAAHPRTLIQVTLQVLRAPEHELSTAPPAQHALFLPVLSALINASVCALLSSNLPMSNVAMATCLVSRANESAVPAEANVSLLDGGLSGSAVDALHVFAFTGKREMVLAQTEGSVPFDAWSNAALQAQEQCCGNGADTLGLLGWLRAELSAEVATKGRWKMVSA